MSEAQFTPGPWFVGEYSNDYYHDGHPIGTTPGGSDVVFCGIHNLADANLIAASPDGYALAAFIKAKATEEETSSHIAVSFEEHDAAMILNMAERILAKARGEA